MNVFNLIAGAGGVSEGLYIWKKYEYTPAINILNPTFRLQHIGNESSKYAIVDCNFDLNVIPKANPSSSGYLTTNDANLTIEFFREFTNGKSQAFRFDVQRTSNETRLSVLLGANTLGYTTKFDGTYFEADIYTYIDDIYSYTGTKTIPEVIGDMVDYVISDKEDAYPDGGEQGGFYYEKFSEMDFGDMNITRISVGEITPASATTSMTITHNLGVTPKFAYVWTDDTLKNQYSIYKYACSFRSPQYLGICALWNMGNSIANTAITQNYTVNSFYTGDIYVSGTYAAFEAGKKYKFVVLA